MNGIFIIHNPCNTCTYGKFNTGRFVSILSNCTYLSILVLWRRFLRWTVLINIALKPYMQNALQYIRHFAN